MIKFLVLIIAKFRVQLLELAGAVTVIVGVNQLSTPAAVIVAGLAVLGKSMELDLRDEKPK